MTRNSDRILEGFVARYFNRKNRYYNENLNREARSISFKHYLPKLF
jgi:hypothetical protein